jgi:ribonuclease D
MSRTTRMMLSLAASLVLLSTMTMAQAAAKSSPNDTSKDKQQHSRLSKAAFWRHHKDASKNAKPAKVMQASSKQVKTAQVKPASAKQVSGKPVTEKKDQKPQQHASNASKPATRTSTKTAPVAKKMKTQPEQGPDKAPLKQ